MISRISRASDSIFRGAATTPGSDAAKRWLENNPFDDDYWDRMENHPDYNPEVDTEGLQTVPYETGYQGVDTFHQSPNDRSWAEEEELAPRPSNVESYEDAMQRAEERARHRTVSLPDEFPPGSAGGQRHDILSLPLAEENMNIGSEQFGHFQRMMRGQIQAADRLEGREPHDNPYERNRREDNIINLASHQFPHVSPLDTYDAFNNEHWRYDPVGNNSVDRPFFKKRVNGVLHSIQPTHLGDWQYSVGDFSGDDPIRSFPTHEAARAAAEDRIAEMDGMHTT